MIFSVCYYRNVDYQSENLRYLLWREKVRRFDWPVQLSSWACCDVHRASDLLSGSAPQSSEQQQIAIRLGLQEEDLQYSRLLELDGMNILQENLKYLFASLDHGQKKHLSLQLDVHATNLSRWLAGTQQPRPTHLASLLRYFGLDPSTNLSNEPLFLSLSVLTDPERRRWLLDRVQTMSPDLLRSLFPAFERLMREP